MNMSDFILNLLMNLSRNPNIILPLATWLLAVWRVARLRQMTMETYEERVIESVAETIKEQISVRLLTPLFQLNHIPLPQGKQPYDVVEALVEQNPEDLELLSRIYSSLETLGANSEFFAQSVQIVANFF